MKPFRYKTLHGWLDYEDYYEEIARILPDGAKFVELGVWKGRSICYFAEWCRILNKNIEICGIDVFEGDWNDNVSWKNDGVESVRISLTRLGVADRIQLIKSDSVPASRMFEDRSIDFVWIDSEHTYEQLCREILAWHKKVKHGGILAGHDLAGFPEVRNALDTMGIKYKPVSSRSWASVVYHNEG